MYKELPQKFIDAGITNNIEIAQELINHNFSVNYLKQIFNEFSKFTNTTNSIKITLSNNNRFLIRNRHVRLNLYQFIYYINNPDKQKYYTILNKKEGKKEFNSLSIDKDKNIHHNNMDRNYDKKHNLTMIYSKYHNDLDKLLKSIKLYNQPKSRYYNLLNKAKVE